MLLGEIRQLVTQKKGNELRQSLDHLLEGVHEEIERKRTSIIQDTMLHDYMLEDLTETLARKLLPGEKKYRYVVVTKCPSCTSSNDQKRHDQAKIVQEIPVMKYIHEVDAIEDLNMNALDPNRFQPRCPACGDGYVITSSRNLIMPAKQGSVYAITARVKSAGRYCQKLVDIIFFDKDNPRMRKRSIADRFAWTAILDTSGYKSEAEQDALCYKMRDKLKSENFLIDEKLMQDNIKDPIRRLSRKRRPETYKMLQFPLKYHGETFEGQIKTLDTHLREQDRKSAIWHDNYVEIEEQLRQDMFREIPEAKMVYDILMKMFTYNGA